MSNQASLLHTYYSSNHPQYETERRASTPPWPSQTPLPTTPKGLPTKSSSSLPSSLSATSTSLRSGWPDGTQRRYRPHVPVRGARREGPLYTNSDDRSLITLTGQRAYFVFLFARIHDRKPGLRIMLNAIQNLVTKVTFARCHPSLNYVVVESKRSAVSAQPPAEFGHDNYGAGDESALAACRQFRRGTKQRRGYLHRYGQARRLYLQLPRVFPTKSCSPLHWSLCTNQPLREAGGHSDNIL